MTCMQIAANFNIHDICNYHKQLSTSQPLQMLLKQQTSYLIYTSVSSISATSLIR